MIPGDDQRSHRDLFNFDFCQILDPVSLTIMLFLDLTFCASNASGFARKSADLVAVRSYRGHKTRLTQDDNEQLDFI